MLNRTSKSHMGIREEEKVRAVKEVLYSSLLQHRIMNHSSQRGSVSLIPGS
jgi:hypothetical protein